MTWMRFIETNLASLFQTALLLVGEPERAEIALSKAIDAVDIFDCDGMQAIEHYVVLNSLPTGGRPSSQE